MTTTLTATAITAISTAVAFKFMIKDILSSVLYWAGSSLPVDSNLNTDW